MLTPDLTPERSVILSAADSPRSGESAKSKDLVQDGVTRNRKGILARLSAGLRWKNSLTLSRLYLRRRGPSISSPVASRTASPLRMTGFGQPRIADRTPGITSTFFLKRTAQLTILALAVFALLGAGDQSARVNDLGHRMMCVCGCNQILLECNHVGCAYSDRMRAELIAAVDRGDNDDLTLQGFVQKYGTTVMAAPTKTGFNQVAWIMPYLVLVLGLTMVTLIVRAWRSRPLVLPVGAVAAVHGAELEHFRDQARKDTEI
jgi:cytochrome c-type biogenesis protein CcmH/NrfF